ncbi:MAG: hypothetical protein KKH22_00350, partial [Proteobacteria bacterium]|nr:hypothetical protein [Pseudomonadota bacterium]
ARLDAGSYSPSAGVARDNVVLPFAPGTMPGGATPTSGPSDTGQERKSSPGILDTIRGWFN